MHAPVLIPLLRYATGWLGCALFQGLLVVFYGLHLAKAFRSPFRANALPPPPARPHFWTRPTL